MKIGFDLDKVFINHPPFLPSGFIDFLYKGHTSSVQHYRIPASWWEILLRKTSHMKIMRPPIKRNIEAVKQLHADGKHELYLISSRFGFLEKQTLEILKDYGLKDLFISIHLNINNLQPHEFKEKVIRETKLDLFVDDDLDLLQYVSQKIPMLKCVCVKEKLVGKTVIQIPVIRNLDKLRDFLA
jgi:hypothetical protein